MGILDFLKKKYKKPSKKDEYDCFNNNYILINKHLIVDDSSTNRIVLRKVLEKRDIDVIEAVNGKDAIDKLIETPVDMVWVDLQMPVMNGIEMTTKLREEYQYDRPIIGITGHVDNISRERCIKAGMNQVIAKPININDVFYLQEKYSSTK